MTTAPPPPPTASRCPPAANNADVFIGPRPRQRSRLPSSPPYPTQESTVRSSNLYESDATAVTARTALSDATAANPLIDATAATAVSDATYATAHTTLSDDDATSKPHQAHDSLWAHIRAVRGRDGELGPRHFRPTKKLGFGDIGRVYLAELRGTGSLFALKVMTKAELKCGGKLGRAQTELEILRQLDHPFLPTLYCDFETVNHSCLVMDYCSGGDLHRLRQVQPGKCFPESVARFYAAEVLLALEYLHMLGIVYRDLKPENVLIRENGHIMLSDFDLSSRGKVSPALIQASKKDMGHLKGSGHCDQLPCIKPWSCMEPSCFSPACLTSRSKRDRRGSSPSRRKSGSYNQVTPLLDLVAEPTNARSMSFVGTHEYLAPEIIRGEGHGSAVDWWALGIFLYELLFGKTPFKGHGSHVTMFNVIGEPLKFPNSPSVSFAAKGLISSLLVKEPQRRLASRRGATEVKQHPFFESINWGLIRCTTSREVVKQVMLDLLKGS